MPSGPGRLTAVAVLVAGLLASPAAGGDWVFRTVALPGWEYTTVSAVNDAGSFAGEVCNGLCEVSTLYVDAHGKVTSLGPAGSMFITGLADNGAVAGDAVSAAGGFEGFWRGPHGQQVVLADPHGSEGTFVNGISPSGKVLVGEYVDAHREDNGFIYRNQKFTTYDVPGAAQTVLTYYRDRMWGGVWFTASGRAHGFYVAGGVLHTVDYPGTDAIAGAGTYVDAIQPTGALVGQVLYFHHAAFGFVDAGGRFTTIRDPKAAGRRFWDGTWLAAVSGDGHFAVGSYSAVAGATLGQLRQLCFIAEQN